MQDSVTPTQDGIVWLRDGTQHDVTDRRRLTGLAVIVVAVIAIAAVAAGRQRTVSGAAVVPPPPQIGDCVATSAADQVWQQLEYDVVPSLVSAPCTGVRAGEVVSVDDQRPTTQTDCSTPTVSYLGLPPGPGEQLGSETVWITRSVIMSYTFGPSPLQVAAGQRWSACVALGIDRDSFRSQPLTESPRDAATRGGAAFDPFAFCVAAPLSSTSIPCGHPHRYEVVADGFNLSAREADSLASCKAISSRLTGLVDPTAGGRLQVELVSYVWDDGASSARATGYQQARSGGGSVMCTVSPVAPGEMLSSTLVGLGERPVPIG